MSITLASVFDERGDAQRAREHLIAAGFDGTQIRIEDSRDERIGRESRDSTVEPKPSRRGFFAELFGLGDSEADDSAVHYAEALRRGSTVLALTLPDEARVSEASDILEDCGAIDIDHRVEQWRAGSHGGHDQNVPPYRDGKRDGERSRVRVHHRAAAAGSGQLPMSATREVYSGPERRVSDDAGYRGPERRRLVAMQ